MLGKKGKSSKPLSLLDFFGGEDGIRTHVRLLANWFRVSPVMTTSIPLRVCQTRSEHLEPQKRGKTKMLERRVRTAKYLVFRTRENPWKQRETGGRKSLSRGGFRVSPVMTTSIRLRERYHSVRWLFYQKAGLLSRIFSSKSAFFSSFVCEVRVFGGDASALHGFYKTEVTDFAKSW